jgi:hypothetical protein
MDKSSRYDGGLTAPSTPNMLERPPKGGRQRTSTPTEAPILFCDVDGVISLFGFREGYGLAAGEVPFAGHPPGTLHAVNGVLHYISASAAEHLAELWGHFELVWATGWEETANEYLPHILGLPDELPYLRFDGYAAAGSAHWKIDAIDRYAGRRPAAWIDDNLSVDCYEWAASRPAPTLLIETERHVGMHSDHVEQLIAFAEGVG